MVRQKLTNTDKSAMIAKQKNYKLNKAFVCAKSTRAASWWCPADGRYLSTRFRYHARDTSVLPMKDTGPRGKGWTNGRKRSWGSVSQISSVSLSRLIKQSGGMEQDRATSLYSRASPWSRMAATNTSTHDGHPDAASPVQCAQQWVVDPLPIATCQLP